MLDLWLQSRINKMHIAEKGHKKKFVKMVDIANPSISF